MVGLIWTIQVVHYPLFTLVGTENFTTYESQHSRRMALLLAVPASVEVVTAGMLVWLHPETTPLWLVLVAGSLLAATWTSTLLVQVPLHRRLGERFDSTTIARLTTSHWLRTLIWSARGILVLTMLLV